MQTTVLTAPLAQGPGKLADIAPTTKLSLKNTTGAVCPFGVFVSKGNADDNFKRLAGTTDDVEGVVLFDHAVNSQLATFPSEAVAFGATDTNVEGVPDKRMANVLRSGFVWVRSEGTITKGGNVWARVTATGDEVVGAARADSDGGDAIQIRNARFASSASADGVALVELVGNLGVDQSLRILLTPGAEAADAIDVVGAVVSLDGKAIDFAAEVMIESLAVTDGKGDLAAASAAVGTLVKANNPATGASIATMTTTAAGLFSFKVSNDVAEDTHVRVTVDGHSRLIKLTFA